MKPAFSHPEVPPGRREILATGATLAVIWLALWLAGYPRPNVDDGFFTGAAIHLAETGRLHNPWIVGWMGWMPGVQLEKFLVQPPLYPLVLAGWLKVFGVSAASLTAFSCSVGLATSLMVWRLFRTLSGSAPAGWLAVAVVGGAMLFRGLRPEPLAMLCLACGQCCLLRWPNAAGWLAGGLLGSCAVICHPLWVILVVPATLVQVYHLRISSGPMTRPLVSLAVGIALALAALVLGLGRDFKPFVHDLAAHARLIAPTDRRLAIFLDHFRVGYDYYVNLAVVGLALAGLALSRPVAWPAILGWLGLVLLGFGLYAAQSTVYLVLAGALLALLASRRGTGRRRLLAFAPALLLAAWLGLQHTFQRMADHQHDARALRGAVLAYLAEARPGQVLFDSTTLRFVFDFRPPAGATDLDWSWSAGRADRWWSPHKLEPRDVWVANPVWSHVRLPDEARRNRFLLGGRAFPSVRSSQALLLVIGSGLPEPGGLPFIRSAAR